MSLKTTVTYRRGDVWLCMFAGDVKPLTILDVVSPCLKTRIGWETAERFHERALARVGRSRFKVGPFYFGVIRESANA